MQPRSTGSPQLQISIMIPADDRDEQHMKDIKMHRFPCRSTHTESVV